MAQFLMHSKEWVLQQWAECDTSLWCLVPAGFAGVVVGVLLLLAAHALVEARGRPLVAVLRFFLNASRLRVWLSRPYLALVQKYPVAGSCQIPWFSSLSDIYKFIWGYKTNGTFVEIGAFDGESFSNTSCLADLGWHGHYVEPIPEYARACASRHAGNSNVHVHVFAVTGEKDADREIELSAAGPFSSAADDEINAFALMSSAPLLAAIGWAHRNEKVVAKTKSLNQLMEEGFHIPPLDSPVPAASELAADAKPTSGPRRRRSSVSSRSGPSSSSSSSSAAPAASAEESVVLPGTVSFAFELLIIDVEGLEWSILETFDIDRYRPQVVIIEIQEKLTRYAMNPKVQLDAIRLENYFRLHGYSILYRDIVNTVFVHRGVKCHGEA